MKPSVIAIESGQNRDKHELLEAALKASRFWKTLESAYNEEHSKSALDKADFCILIKPNLAMFLKDRATITDPELVECLIDLLHEHGFSKIRVGESNNIFYKWLNKREIVDIAARAGYNVIEPDTNAPVLKCITGGKNIYEFVDFSRDTGVDAYSVQGRPKFERSYSLKGVKIPETWAKAHFRISFAKNKTHEEYGYTLCLKNLLGVFPEADKHLHYHSRMNVEDVCFEIFKAFPVHFNIIDAYVSSHGITGAQIANTIRTETIIAGESTILVDWVGALKMGIDPCISPVNQKALQADSLPEYKIIGSLKPYEGWQPVHPRVQKAMLYLDNWDSYRNLFWLATFKINAEFFPWKKGSFKHSKNEIVNRFFSPFWECSDKDRFFRQVLILLLDVSRCMFFGYNAFERTFCKNRLMRKELPITLHIDVNDEAPFEKLAQHIRPLEEMVATLPKRNGKCHMFMNKGLLYYSERFVRIEFGAFVEKVKIAEAVATMKDCIGVQTIHLPQNPQYQFERTVYLPQPNILALLNAKDIDVTKIERIEKKPDFHKVIWKMVFSDNRSALFDEGAITFKEELGGTRIKIMVHQALEFSGYLLSVLPFEGLCRIVMVKIYDAYFKRTMNNYCEAVEGTFKKVGRDWIADDKPAEKGFAEILTSKLQFVRNVRDKLCLYP